MYHFKTYQTLPEDAIFIRTEVFMMAQGFQGEFDDIDKTAVHIVLYSDEVPVGTCRIYWNSDKNAFIAGRIAVRKEWRGQSLGAAILQEAEKQVSALGGKRLLLAAQLQAQGFYEKQGYDAVENSAFFDEDCPHIWMSKELQRIC